MKRRLDHHTTARSSSSRRSSTSVVSLVVLLLGSQTTTTSHAFLLPAIHQRCTVASNKHFVAKVPDSVVEQFSTETLLDQILDESLRFSARRPIIMEASPIILSSLSRMNKRVNNIPINDHPVSHDLYSLPRCFSSSV